MKMRTIGISNDLCPEGMEIDVWYDYERGNDNRMHPIVENVVNASNKSIINYLSQEYLWAIALEMANLDGQESEDAKSIKDDEQILAFKECTI